jgi:hypothetical protein
MKMISSSKMETGLNAKMETGLNFKWGAGILTLHQHSVVALLIVY